MKFSWIRDEIIPDPQHCFWIRIPEPIKCGFGTTDSRADLFVVTDFDFNKSERLRARSIEDIVKKTVLQSRCRWSSNFLLETEPKFFKML
jgi:hypothetical protein